MTYVGDWAGRGALYWPERLAVVDDGKERAGRFTYLEMNDRASRLAAWLRAAGVGLGDRVGILARNRVEYLDCFFACGKLGAVFVPYSWRLHPRELVQLVNRTAPAAFLFAEEFRAGVAEVRRSCGSVRAWIHLDGAGIEASRPFQEVLETPPEAVTNERASEEDIACLLFTGGTTGLPKAARISHRMIAWNILNTTIHELRGDDVTITHTPMFHTGGLLVYTIPLLALGGTVVLMPAWDPGRMLELIERERVTVFFCVPAQYQVLLDSPKLPQTDLSSLRFVTSGGAPLPVSVIERWGAIHRVPFKQGFGMTEFGPGAFSMGPEHALAKAGSIGRPNYFVSARIVDDAGRPLGPHEVGELVLKGPSMFSGYFQDPEATAEAIDGEGWFHTGDLAFRDEDDFYFIVDRKKDMFISGGENVYPAEVERALAEHPAVRMCAVVGVADERWGEVGEAWVVLREGASPSPEELLAFLRARVARYKVPTRIRFVPELPMSPQGKVLKRELRRRVDASPVTQEGAG